MKKILSAILTVIVMLSILSQSVLAVSNSYSSDYRYWSQGASGYPRVKKYGCYIVALARMIVESDVDTSSSFNPDVFAKWEEDNGYIADLDTSIGQTSLYAPEKYAETKGKELKYVCTESYSDSTLWSYINSGYYRIAHIKYDGGSHHYVFVSNTDSINNGTLMFYESWSSAISVGVKNKSSLLGTYSGSYISEIYVYKGSNSNYDTEPPTVAPTAINIGDNFYAYIRNTYSGYDIIQDDNQNAVIWATAEENNHLWNFIRQDDGSYKIISMKNGLCLDISNSGTTQGTNVQLWEDNGTSAQRWYISGEQGAYVLKGGCTDCVIDITDAVYYNGTNIQLCNSTGDPAQKYIIEKIKPWDAQISADKTNVTVGDTVTFTHSIYGATIKGVGIDNNGVRYTGYNVYSDNGSSTYTFNETGTYCCIIEGTNSEGYQCSSGVSIKVSEKTFDIAFDATGGSVSTTDKVVINNSTYGDLPIPTREGYKFNGWYTASSGGDQITSDSIVQLTSAQTLYAQWEVSDPCTKSTVTKTGTTFDIASTVYNIDETATVIIAGYKNGRFVTMDCVAYNQEEITTSLMGDIDTIKVMVWSDLLTQKPLCEEEIITSDEFITQ